VRLVTCKKLRCVTNITKPDYLILQGAKALEEFAESVRNESGAGLPKDGTVAEGTSNVLVFLEQLAEYADMAGAVLRRNLITDQSVLYSKDPENVHKMVLGVYVSKFVYPSCLFILRLTQSD